MFLTYLLPELAAHCRTPMLAVGARRHLSTLATSYFNSVFRFTDERTIIAALYEDISISFRVGTIRKPRVQLCLPGQLEL